MDHDVRREIRHDFGDALAVGYVEALKAKPFHLLAFEAQPAVAQEIDDAYLMIAVYLAGKRAAYVAVAAGNQDSVTAHTLVRKPIGESVLITLFGRSANICCRSSSHP